jgi:hypothetical protein
MRGLAGDVGKFLFAVIYSVIYGAGMLAWGLFTQLAIVAVIAVPFLLYALVR